MSSDRFNLVQRLEATQSEVPINPLGGPACLRVSGFILNAGAKFDLAYMGGSEFEEPRTLIGAANRIASAAHRLKIVTRKITRPSYSEDVHFIATEETLADALPVWGTWAGAENPRTREPIGYFRDLGDADAYESTVGWWALDEDVIWSREREIAGNIKDTFVNILNAVPANKE